MKTRPPDPRRLALEPFIREQQSLDGEWPAGELPRWAELQTPPADVALPPVRFAARGELLARQPQPETWLQLDVEATAWMTCQRCLQPFSEALALDRRIRFVHGEDEAERLDAEQEDDVLAFRPLQDLGELAEDELILALPLVPRHPGPCPQPLPAEAAAVSPQGEAVTERQHPFAALAALKRPPEG